MTVFQIAINAFALVFFIVSALFSIFCALTAVTILQALILFAAFVLCIYGCFLCINQVIAAY